MRAAEIFYDTWFIKSVRFDIDDCTGKTDTWRLGRTRGKFISSAAYTHRCAAARMAARQQSSDLATVVNG